MKSLKELKLSRKTKQKVETWLLEWLEMLIQQADGQQGNVHRADFVKEDFFYFTNCNDILAEDPESLSKETNPKITRRKQKVMLQLFIKNLLGVKVGKVIKCSHCGYEGMLIDGTYNGHFTFCPKCKYLVVNGYLETMGETVKAVLARFPNTEEKNEND